CGGLTICVNPGSATPKAGYCGSTRNRRDGPVGPGSDAHAVAGAVGEDPGSRGVGVVDDAASCGKGRRQARLDVLASDEQKPRKWELSVARLRAATRCLPCTAADGVSSGVSSRRVRRG